jgi:hypothetical protein
MWSHVKKFKGFEKDPKYSHFFEIFLFFIATNFFLLKFKITSYLVCFCDFERVFSKNGFFSTRFKLFFNEFF